MKPWLRAAAVAALALAAGCESYNPLRWVGIVSGPAHPPTPLAPIAAKVNPQAAWTASVGKSADLHLRPAIAGGRVYAASAGGTITIVAEDDGHLVDRFESGKPISGGVEVADGKIFVGTLKGEVLAIDPAGGKVRWIGHVAGEVIAPPAVSHDVVVVRTADGRIFGFSVADGKRLWVYQRPTPSLLLRSPAGVLAVGGDVVAGYPNGKLIALDLDDGKLTWEVTVAYPRGSTELERIADVAGLPVIDGGNICAAAYQEKVACFEISTRNMIWSRDLSTARSLASDEKNLYLVDDTGAVHALDKKSGASVWKQAKLLYRDLTAPVVFDGKVVVGDLQGYIHVLSPDDGAIIGRLATDGTPVVSLVPGLSGLFVQTAGGAVLRVRFGS
jgi:outer membrane protein assembly factor BamB